MRILHLETSSFFRKVVQKGTDLQQEEYFGCESIQEAKKILDTKAIDLILTAQEMTDGRIEDLLKETADSACKDIPIIMVSSSDDMELRKRYFELGVIDFISKDNFSVEKLREEIDAMKKHDDLTRELRKASIAIIDDSQFILKVVHNILSLQEIHDVDLYRDPRDLLDSGKSYDIYMVDMFMPGMSGKQLTMTLRNDNPMAVIIIISSMGKDST
ncbi:MAG: response regulator, partial [Spirochaetales bacterium]|nr:response regulator [Spirochaetales bacterium]